MPVNVRDVSVVSMPALRSVCGSVIICIVRESSRLNILERVVPVVAYVFITARNRIPLKLKNPADMDKICPIVNSAFPLDY